MQILPSRSKITGKQLWLLLLLGLAIIATLLLAAGFPELELRSGRPFPLAGLLQMLGESRIRFGSGVSMPVDVIRVLAACLWLLLFISIIAFIISSEVRKAVFRRVISYLIWILLFLALLRVLQPHLPFLESEPQAPAQAPLSEIPNPAELIPPPPQFIVDPPQWFVILVSILLITVPLTIIWLAWYLFSTLKGDEDESPLEMITKEAQQALKGIQAGADLKDTVMRCYAEMSQILSQRRNLYRSQGMTPREFEQYLAESGLRSEHIKRLTRLFESVRYGNKPPGRREELEAIDCLTAIVRAYGQPS